MKTKDLAQKKEPLTPEEKQKLLAEIVAIGVKIMPKFSAKPKPLKK